MMHRETVVVIVACHCMSDGAVTCDPVTGSCQCLPGVTGPNCDQCMSRWVMIENVGCRGQFCHILRTVLISKNIDNSYNK